MQSAGGMVPFLNNKRKSEMFTDLYISGVGLLKNGDKADKSTTFFQ